MNIHLKKYFFVVAILACSSLFAIAQKNDSIPFRKNVVSGEVLGNGWPGSINYERMIINNKNSFVTVRIGGNGSLFPLMINQVCNKSENNHLEFGGGIALGLGYFPHKVTYVFAGTACLMYRYQKPQGRFVFRAGWTPLYWFDDTQDFWGIAVFLLTPGVSFGYAFK